MRAWFIVCGGRYFSGDVAGPLNRLLRKYWELGIIQGGCGQKNMDTYRVICGADLLAKEWAEDNEQSYLQYDADWDKHGRAAGPLRNTRMLEVLQMRLGMGVVAFPGGKGTANMCKQAEDWGITVWRVGHE